MNVRLQFLVPTVACGLALAGCGYDGRDEMADSAGASAGAGSAPGVDSASGGQDTDGDGDGDAMSGDGPRLDVAPGAGSGDPDGGADECTNVDILFVIDDSGSMADNQEQLIASFPGFVAGIQEHLEFAESYHIGVTTTSVYGENGPVCWEHGDLITQTVGVPASSNAVCGPFTSGSSYLDETEPDLAAKFQCVAKVGGGGDDDEKPITSLLNALAPGNNAPGECNAGFSRLDSLLIVVIITDEDDVVEDCLPDEWPCFPTGTEGTPDDWHDQLLTYKANIPQNVVVLSILGRQAGNPCGATPAANLLAFTNRFGGNGHVGDICASSYDAFFTSVLPVIDQACKDYIPPEG